MGPGKRHDNLEGLAVAAAGQVDDEWGEPPVAARSDAHDEAVGQVCLSERRHRMTKPWGRSPVEDADAYVQLLAQLEDGPPEERERGPAVLGVQPLVKAVLGVEPDRPPCPLLLRPEDDSGEASGDADLQQSSREEHDSGWLC